MTPKIPKIDVYHGVIVRPNYLRARFSQEAWDKIGDLVELIIEMTRGDIDHGTSNYIMVDKNFQPTGAPPPDPEGPYCMICGQRIWAHDGNTAFPMRFGCDNEGNVDVSGGACCEECSQLSDDELCDKLNKFAHRA